MAEALEEAKIDQGVGEGVEIEDGVAVAKVRVFDAKSDSLAVDAFSGRTLSVNLFVGLTVPIQRIPQAGANAGRHANRAATFASLFMMNGTRLFDEFGLDMFGVERTDVLAAFVFDDCHGTVGVGEKKRHTQTSLTNG